MRFTPTGVGKTMTLTLVTLNSTVHPHRCGENAIGQHGADNSRGSPPQVWGKHGVVAFVAGCARFTPTGVGKTFCVPVGRKHRQVHPHRCGENSEAPSIAAEHSGSPPQVWGKRYWSIPNTVFDRFTPTGVGKTLHRPSISGRMPVHPHRCGENNRLAEWKVTAVGSPPQVWGKRVTQRKPCRNPRFTPTGVGKTSICRQQQPRLQVHPHRCGENQYAKPAEASRRGSPPQVWGKRQG